MKETDSFAALDWVIMATLATIGIPPLNPSSFPLAPVELADVNLWLFWLATDREKGRIRRIKAIREAIGCSLKSAKEFGDTCEEDAASIDADIYLILIDLYENHRGDMAAEILRRASESLGADR